jgi:hypothetical protein
MKKLAILPLSLFFVFSVYPDDLTDDITTFWAFISANEDNIVKLSNPEDPLYTKIYEQIQLVDENIYVMISNQPIENKKEITITCGGDTAYFDLCDAIVALAPAYTHLKPVALLQPAEKLEPFIFDGIELRAEDVRVTCQESGAGYDLLFVLSGEHLAALRNDDSGWLYSLYMYMLLMMTQQTLGERVAGERVTGAYIPLVSLAIPSISFSELRNVIK